MSGERHQVWDQQGRMVHDQPQQVPPEEREADTEEALRQRGAAALDAMRQARAVATNIADSGGTLTSLQLSQAVRALARGQALMLTVGIQVVRLVTRKLDGDD